MSAFRRPGEACCDRATTPRRASALAAPRGDSPGGCRRSLDAFLSAAVYENSLESELFGHVKGAFTGAVLDKRGLFETAHDGTCFLDEIGEISPCVQAKLLRVLQEREIKRVGGTGSVGVDVRVIAATNRDLGAFIDGVASARTSSTHRA